ncbi:MAG TPA: DUF362 domain-containing protein [Bryobacteraceae bacterium]|nr:DUF362 domain-containing protein [Bryobacteraceae bacterium]
MMHHETRREWIRNAALSGAYLAGSRFARADAPASRVSIAKCKTYDAAELVPALDRMFDQLGGLGRMVKGKTVAIKINLTGAPNLRLANLPIEDTHYTNKHVIAATVHLIGKAGARRIRVLESPWSTAGPVEEYLRQAGWDPSEILSAAPDVAFENTNYLGDAKKYVRFTPPFGGYIYPGYDLNHYYHDCDVFVSLAKLKEHATAGVTLSMKNCFGITPATIYGQGAGVDEPSIVPTGSRGSIVHSGNREPSKSAPSEKDPHSSRDPGYRVPRVVVDLISSRPIHLAVIDGVKSMTGGEGPWIRRCAPCSPGVLVAGLNPVNTDAVSMAVMGFDPLGDRGTPPFETCDSTLHLAEAVGVGTRDLKRIEVVGTPIREALFDYAAIRRRRRA